MNATTYAGPIVHRFAWKEYRLLRGLWLAVLMLGLLVQWVSGVLSTAATDFAAMYLGIAWAAAVLYAVGAAAIIFSIEHEDETFDFLAGLPTTWWPLYVAKLLMVTLSAILLAATLSVVAVVVAGAASPLIASQLLGLFGIGILEAVAWGMLFSLLVKRPIGAALLTLVVGVSAVQLAVSSAATSDLAITELASYSEAIGLRLAIVAAVLLCGIAVARRWLPVGRVHRVRTASVGRQVEPPAAADEFVVADHANRAVTRRGMFARLLWQTWRESWRMLLMPVGVAMFLFVGLAAISWAVQQLGALQTLATAYFLPTLYGALAFGADQRRRQYRFLAEHAARPRWVWFARHVVWFSALCLVSGALAILATVLAVRSSQLSFEGLVSIGDRQWVPTNAARAHEYYLGQLMRGAGLAGMGALVAYAIGQLCSMLLRSEILAAALALVLSVVLAAWVAVLVLWNLSGLWFLLPLALGLMLATWLRAPDWITERNTWQAWWKPAAVVAVPLLAAAVTLPAVRLAQVPVADRVIKEVEELFTAFAASDTPDARETAAMYLRAAATLNAWLVDDPLKRWEAYEVPINRLPREMQLQLRSDLRAGFLARTIDEQQIPVDELPAYREAREQHRQAHVEARSAAVAAAVEASFRPSCRFDFNWRSARLMRRVPSVYAESEDGRRYGSMTTYTNAEYGRMVGLIELVAGMRAGVSGDVDQMIAALRMCAHLREGQPTAVFTHVAGIEGQVRGMINNWAQNENRTAGELRDAIEKLGTHFAAEAANPTFALAVDHLLVRDAIDGKAQPLTTSERPTPRDHLAFLANELPWERERARRALDLVTAHNAVATNRLMRYLGVGKGSLYQNFGNPYNRLNLEHWLRPSQHENQPQSWAIARPEVMTSFLLMGEYSARVSVHEFYRAICDTELWRRATLLRVALLAYRKDHGEYPAMLAELVPEYLAEEPIDPYSNPKAALMPNQSFHYMPNGLDLPLRQAQDSQIEAGTPLFWSRGLANFTLERRGGVRETVIDDDLEFVESYVEPYYSLQSTRYLRHLDVAWYYEPTHVFPLPK